MYVCVYIYIHNMLCVYIHIACRRGGADDIYVMFKLILMIISFGDVILQIL